MADEDRDRDRLPGLAHDRRGGIVADEVGAEELVGSHVGHPGVVAEQLGCPVVIDQPVMLPLDVGQLGVDEALDLAVPAQLRGQVAEAPGDVAVAAAGRHRAILGVDQG